jgi:hypothetical protein
VIANPIQRNLFKESGGARRDRTADLVNAIHALSQLSYGPDQNSKIEPPEASNRVAGSGALELGRS